MSRNGRAKFGQGDLVQKFGVRAFPTVQLLTSDGKSLEKMVGVAPNPDQEIARINQHLGR